MSEEKRSPSEEVRRMLDERGIEYDAESYLGSVFWGNASYEQIGDDYTRLIVEDATPEQAIAATVGKDIEHYDGSGRRGTVAILQGGRKPEEVLFVRKDGVTHYLPEDVGACHLEERHGDWYCTGCGEMVGTCDTTSELYIDGNAITQWRHCPNCGGRIVKEDS